MVAKMAGLLVQWRVDSMVARWAYAKVEMMAAETVKMTAALSVELPVELKVD